MTEPQPRTHYKLTLAILTTAGSAFALQQTMVFPALPTLQRDLETTPAWATWILTVFLLTAAVATPILGKLGDQYGKERMLVVSLGIFFAGSVAATFAWDIWSLIAFRALQGAGGAVFPLSFGIIRDEFPPEKAATGIGLISAVFGIGGGLGIVLSGVVVDHLSWRWLFVVGGAPVGLAILLVHRFVPESPVKTRSRVDVPGAFLLSLGLICLLLALTEGESWGWRSPPIAALFAAAAAAFVMWTRLELRVPEPMVDVRMLARRPILFTNVTALINGFAMFGAFVLVPSFVQASGGGYGFGASATRTGLYMLPGSLSMLAAGPLSGVLGRRLGSKWPLAVGSALTALSCVWLARWNDEPWQIVVAMILLSSGAAAAFAAMANIITSSVRPTETGVANGMNTVMRTVGGIVGGQIAAALLASRVLPNGLPAESAFTTAFWMSAAAALVAAAAALATTPGLRPVRVSTG